MVCAPAALAVAMYVFASLYVFASAPAIEHFALPLRKQASKP
jgi:hypothetical protein